MRNVLEEDRNVSLLRTDGANKLKLVNRLYREQDEKMFKRERKKKDKVSKMLLESPTGDWSFFKENM